MQLTPSEHSILTEETLNKIVERGRPLIIYPNSVRGNRRSTDTMQLGFEKQRPCNYRPVMGMLGVLTPELICHCVQGT
jgi:hypothetical protein